MDRRWMILCNPHEPARPGWLPSTAHRLLILCASLSPLACGNAIPTPELGRHSPQDPFAIVPYPPPPAHVEVVPGPPEGVKDPVWVDGEWQWRNRRWVWLPGRWEEPYPGAFFAPSTTVRRPDGGLVWFGGVWHFPKGKR
ncbi:hypothetical protein [Chondromyces crocatus]|uniref:Lipoprotein n=1 Tax=Chondromyces crocatus TaxID=52 RepID=A0A0K1E5V1_CHOCO|nr:hypothetical protein [Chondromyces crocatus]AKT36224.1 uncharacterized protein CMC5_003380 [Chondromyces crocatus]